jgi:hypothetical protein
MRAKHLDAWIDDGGFEKITGIVPNPPFALLPERTEPPG